MKKSCKIEKCEETYYAKGMCQKHYNKQYKEDHKDDIQQYKEENKENILQKHREYNNLNKEDILEKSRARQSTDEFKIKSKNTRLENIDEHRSYDKNYYELNKKTILTSDKIRRQKPEVKEKNNLRLKEKRKKNVIYNLRINVSNTINKMLKYNSSSKRGRSIKEYLPYTIEELKQHLERLFSHPNNLDMNGNVWMTWGNRGIYNPQTWDDNDPTTWTWQLDHRIAQSKLPYTSMEDENFKKCWALENLHPLSAKINIQDGNRRLF